MSLYDACQRYVSAVDYEDENPDWAYGAADVEYAEDWVIEEVKKILAARASRA